MQANLYGMDISGTWVPVRVGETGLIPGGGGGGGSSTVSPGAEETYAPWTYAAASGGIVNTSDVTLVTAPGVGKSNYLTSMQVMNTSGTATELVVKSSSTVLWRGVVGASMTQPAGFVFLPPLIAANNTALTVACITTATATYVNAQGYTDGTLAALNAGLTSETEIFDQAGEQIFDAAGSPIYLAA
jgi:hypothetical protein